MIMPLGQYRKVKSSAWDFANSVLQNENKWFVQWKQVVFVMKTTVGFSESQSHVEKQGNTTEERKDKRNECNM
ncbi:hypothetical protein HPS54_11450 [Prevotella sp. PCHR]|uniref:Uncharacterized protein n=1 Tax=Xylanibacter caecicola TaxID=2736294 RepID=A0ABX2B796_9BACT|nr:hypothetical protein [Xylanibacter caecicola]